MQATDLQNVLVIAFKCICVHFLANRNKVLINHALNTV